MPTKACWGALGGTNGRPESCASGLVEIAEIRGTRTNLCNLEPAAGRAADHLAGLFCHVRNTVMSRLSGRTAAPGSPTTCLELQVRQACMEGCMGGGMKAAPRGICGPHMPRGGLHKTRAPANRTPCFSRWQSTRPLRKARAGPGEDPSPPYFRAILHLGSRSISEECKLIEYLKILMQRGAT